jgi:hypothetical protein
MTGFVYFVAGLIIMGFYAKNNSTSKSINKTKKPWTTVRVKSAADYAYVFTFLSWVKYGFRLSFLRFVYPPRKPMMPHLPHCQESGIRLKRIASPSTPWI